MSKVWMIASGKGGTGKTTLTASLAVVMAKLGKKVGVVDLSVGLKGADLLLGMENRVVFDMFDVLDDTCTIENAMVAHENYSDLQLLSTSQTEPENPLKARRLESLVKKLRKRFDVVLLDCPSGVGENVLEAARAADACILTVTPDDAAIRAAERMSSLIFEKVHTEMHLAVNGVQEKLIYEGLMMQPEQLAMVLDAPLIGEIPHSESAYRALLMHKTPVETDDKGYTAAVTAMAKRMLDEDADVPFKTYRVRRRKWFHHAEE